MKPQDKRFFRAKVSEEREEQNCDECNDRVHSTELVNLNAQYKNLKYNSLVCECCQKQIHLLVEVLIILNNAANES
jgi:hypothetical protein